VRIREEVDAWSGGTSIGASLAAFDRRYGKTRLSARTVVIIVSDGWDRGDTALIAQALSSMRRRAYTIVWLNPLLGNPSDEPLTRGMAAALPLVDHFASAHNLTSLRDLAGKLTI